MEHLTRIGKYELEKFLGGGMSHVYRAKDSVLGRVVAVKVLTDSGMADPETKARFLQEARMASNIQHENIISVYDFGEDQGRPYMVMEFLDGESLRDALKNEHMGDVNNRLRIALQAGRALDYIHTKKIIHRDIKPENINLDSTGKVKLMDFGIAKREGVQLTRAGFTLGTPYYMAPEQVLGRPLTPQADVYAYGILIFELLTGAKPVMGESIERIFQVILYEPLNLEPLKDVKIPPALVGIVGRCTEKQPEKRPPSVGSVCDELERILMEATGAKAGPNKATMLKPAVPPKSPAPTSGTSAAAKPRPPAPSSISNKPSIRTGPATVDGLPSFLDALPAALRTQVGLMILAGAGALVLMLLLYEILKLAHAL
jgi:serine/threonine-protein kinase